MVQYYRAKQLDIIRWENKRRKRRKFQNRLGRITEIERILRGLKQTEEKKNKSKMELVILVLTIHSKVSFMEISLKGGDKRKLWKMKWHYERQEKIE